MDEKVLHDLKCIALAMKKLTEALDQFFIDVECKEKEAINGRS